MITIRRVRELEDENNRALVQIKKGRNNQPHLEVARDSVESQRPSEFIDYYATATDLATGCLGAARAIEARNAGMCLTPMTLRNWRSATSRPDPIQRSM
jgi:hypothetical protein